MSGEQAFRAGQLKMLTELLELWGEITERMRSEVEFVYLSARRDAEEGKPQDIESLAHQSAIARVMKEYLDQLKEIGDPLFNEIPPDEPS